MALKPEVKKDIKKESKTAELRPKLHFAFTRKNYTLLATGVVLLIIGYLTLSGGGSKDPNQFSYDLFSACRMVVAPLILMSGYVIVAYGILVKDKNTGAETN